MQKLQAGTGRISVPCGPSPGTSPDRPGARKRRGALTERHCLQASGGRDCHRKVPQSWEDGIRTAYTLNIPQLE